MQHFHHHLGMKKRCWRFGLNYPPCTKCRYSELSLNDAIFTRLTDKNLYTLAALKNSQNDWTAHIHGNKEERCWHKMLSSHNNDIHSMMVTTDVSKTGLQMSNNHQALNQSWWNLSLWHDVSVTTSASCHMSALQQVHLSATYKHIFFSEINISQGSVATCLKSGGIFNDGFIVNFAVSVPVKAFLESVNSNANFWYSSKRLLFWPTLYACNSEL